MLLGFPLSLLGSLHETRILKDVRYRDLGAGRSWQMNAQVSQEGQTVVDLIGQLLAPIGIARGDMDKVGSGPDLTPMVRAGLPSFNFTQDGTDYFDLHHTADDTLDKIESAALDQNVAAFAVFAWLAANSTVEFCRAASSKLEK